MLRIESVRSGYGKSEVLRGVSMSIDAGQVVTIIGANGAGKSTLVNTLSKLIPTMSGRIEFEGRDITGLPASAIVELGIIQVPEGPKTARPAHRRRKPDPRCLPGAAPVDDRTRKSQKVRTGAVSPACRAGQTAPATLSGGEQQMVAMGRALMAKPRLLLLMNRPSGSPRSSSPACSRHWNVSSAKG